MIRVSLNEELAKLQNYENLINSWIEVSKTLIKIKWNVLNSKVEIFINLCRFIFST